MTAPDLVPWLAAQSDWYGARQAEVCDLLLPYARWVARDTCHIIHVPRDARQHGATVFGAVGTCWGGYLVARLCSYGEFRAGVSFHPATTFVAETVNQEKLYEASRAGVD